MPHRHFEVDQEVSLELLVAGNEAKNWKRPYSHNEEGDVQFREKSPEGTASDAQLVTWVLALIISLVTAPSILSVFDVVGGLAGSVIQLTLPAFTLRILPAATRALVREFRKALAGDATTMHLHGDHSSLIYNARAVSVGSTRIHPSTPAPEDATPVQQLEQKRS